MAEKSGTLFLRHHFNCVTLLALPQPYEKIFSSFIHEGANTQIIPIHTARRWPNWDLNPEPHVFNHDAG